jgi:hypothetical protein
VLAVQNYNAVVSPSLPPQTTAASFTVTLGRGNSPSRYSPGIQLVHSLFDAPHTESPGKMRPPPTLGSLQIPSTFPKKMMEVIRHNHANCLCVATHHNGLNDYGIRSPAAKITFRHCTLIWLACEKNVGLIMENTT